MVAISIIMPVHNENSLIEKSINSVAKQTFNDVELICVDDGSTDKSLDTLYGLSEKYEFVKVVSQDHKGLGKARNYGMDIAEGEYIAFLNPSDCFVAEDALNRLYDVASLNDADVVTGNSFQKTVNSDEIFPFDNVTFFTESKVILPEEYGLPLNFYKSIYKSTFLRKNIIYFPNLLYGESSVFLAEILSIVDKIYVEEIDVYACDYANVDNQFDSSKKIQDNLLHYKSVFDYLKEPRFKNIVLEYKKTLINFLDKLNPNNLENVLKISKDVFGENSEIFKDIQKFCREKEYIIKEDHKSVNSPSKTSIKEKVINKFLNKSNSYVYYKNQYDKLIKSDKNLKNTNKKFENDNKILKRDLKKSKDKIVELQKKLGKYTKQEIITKLNNNEYSDLTVAIKSPNYKGHHHWGDYFFSLALKKSFNKLGFNVIIQEREDWYDDNVKVDINVVLRGVVKYEPNFDEINVMWNISHPDMVENDEYELYDICFISSEKYANKINSEVTTLVKPLLQCTDPEVFYNEKNEDYYNEILFVGVTRGVYRQIIKDVMQTDFDVSIYGMDWEEFVDDKYIKGNFIPNEKLHEYYSSCKILLNDHWEDMRDWDFPSNRLFDALACGAFVISDKIPSAETLFDGNIVTYDNSDDLNDKLEYYLNHDEERIRMAQKGREIVLKYHTFDNRANTIVESIKNLTFDDYGLTQNELPAYSDIRVILNKLSEKVFIIVNVCEDFENLKKCIESIINYTAGDYELILLTENIQVQQINNFLENIKDSNIQLINDVNFINNLKTDVILLDSNTIVTPNWLQKLVICAYLKLNVGMVIPFSNDFGMFSFYLNEIGDIINHLDINSIANLVEKSSKRIFMEVPEGNNFCMYIKNEVINEMDILDNEWNMTDFSNRIIQNGWKIVMDDSTYIYHDSTKKNLFNEISFGNRKENLLSLNDLSSMTNNLIKNVDDFLHADIIKKNILFVLHGGGGGTLYHNDDLMNFLEKDYNCYLLVSNSQEITLYKFSNSNKEKINKWQLNSAWHSEDIHDDEFSQIYFHVLTNYSIDIVHVQHLIHHTFDLPKIGKILGIPIVLSFHDFYFICLSHNLIDENNRYCAGECDLSLNCHDRMGLSNYSRINDYVMEWRSHVNELFSNVDLFVTPSDVSKNIYCKYYPSISNRVHVISHGRDICHEDEKLYEVPSLSNPIKILFIGNTYLQKGSEIIKELYNLDKNHKLEIHFLGDVGPELKGIGIQHGRYERDDLKNLIGEIKPSFIGIFSIWPETFCYTLTEAWSYNIPVLISKIGILEERLLTNDGGWFIDYENMNNTYKLILEISDNSEEYLSKVENINYFHFKTVEEMGNEYIELYNEFFEK